MYTTSSTLSAPGQNKLLTFRSSNIHVPFPHPNKTLTHASETWTLTKGDRKKMNIFERKVYRRILGPVYDNEKENWRILTNTEIYAMVKKPTITGTIRLNRLRWLGHVQRM